MDCERFRLAISARLDREDPGVEASVVDHHLAGCPACRRFAEGTATLNRAVRVTPADAVPDLTPSILAAIGTIAPKPRFDPTALRAALGAVAVAQLVLGLPALLFGWGADTHLGRELAAFDLALAVGFLFAAWRPLRAYGMLPFAAALVGGLALTTTLDVSAGRASATPEAAHLLELVGLLLIWQLARAVTPPPERWTRHGDGRLVTGH